MNIVAYALLAYLLMAVLSMGIIEVIIRIDRVLSKPPRGAGK